MKIEKGQIISGQPVLKVRDFFKRFERYDVENAAYFFAISKKAAKAMCLELAELGYSERVPLEQMPDEHKKENWYDLLPLGHSLRLARAVPSINRQKADRLLKEFMTRVEEVNSNRKYVYKVTKVLLFGSYIRSDVTELNDVDVAIELTWKYDDPEVRRRKGKEYTQAAIEDGRRFKNWLDRLVFPETDVKEFLRNRSQYISLHPIDDEVLQLTDTKQLYPKSFIDKLTDLLS